MKHAGLKVVVKEAKVLNKRGNPNSRRRKGKKRQMQPKKAPVMEI